MKALGQWWQGARGWWKDHEGWTAALTMGAGLFALGYCVASINYQRVIADNRAQHAADVRSVADGYRTALQSKDETIKALTQQTVKAATAADHAAQTAKAAAEKAAQAAEEHP